MPLSDEDKAIRLTGIGASEAPAVCGVDPRRTPLDVWYSKPTASRKAVSVVLTSDAMEAGNELEDGIARMYARRRKVELQQRAEEAKAWRTVVLDLLPEDIKDECEAQIRATRRSEVENDPDAAKKKIMRAFDTINVLPSSLGEYLGHPLDEATPSEIDELRGVFQTVKEGQATWHECLAAKRGGESTEEDPKAAALKKKLEEASRKGKKVQPPPAAPATAPIQEPTQRTREPGEDG